MQFRRLVLLALGIGVGLSAPVAAQAQTDPAAGKRAFLRCAACHGVTVTGPKRLGPHLQGVVGRPSASVAGFAYSPAMKAAKVRWDEATLDRFLTRPAGVVPGTSMIFVGLPKPEDRKALIAYLKKPMP